MDDAGAAILIAMSLASIITVFSALIWAAVADGRDERAFRARHPDLSR